MLKPGARVHMAARSDLGWSVEAHLQATTINHLKLLTHTLVLANSDPDKGPIPEPEMYPHPAEAARIDREKAAAAGRRAEYEARQAQVIIREKQRLLALQARPDQ